MVAILIVCIGSKNPSKIEGVKRAFTTIYRDVLIYSFAIDTGLPPQPFGLDVTMEGARIRALKSIESNDRCIYGVGVEAGIFEVNKSFYDVQIAFVVDRSGKGFYGFSPAFKIPDRFVDLIKNKVYKELEDVVDNFYGTKNIGECGGFIKLLSRGVVLREDLTYYAVLMALIPFINSNIY
jgi:inosine/xanthosine triphosphatase